GDIKSNNIKSIMIELDVTPSTDKEKDEVMTFEFSYTDKDSRSKVISGSMILGYTDDDKKIGIKTEETEVALAGQRAAEIDLQNVELLKQGKTEEAKKMKQLEMQMLQRVQHVDKTGRVGVLYQKAGMDL